MSISIKEIAWAAGFIEGEGTAGVWGRNSLVLRVGQLQLEPLKRLQRFFGGSVYTYPKTYSIETKPMSHWTACGMGAAGIIMTIYDFLSPRRKKQFGSALQIWKLARIAAKHRTHCSNGHSYTRGNTFKTLKGHRQCRTCHRNYERKRNQYTQ